MLFILVESVLNCIINLSALLCTGLLGPWDSWGKGNKRKKMTLIGTGGLGAACLFARDLELDLQVAESDTKVAESRASHAF